MSQVCSKCSRANPADAVYCYNDGALLQGHGGHGGPVNPGTAPFATPFVFPSGQTCQNFDQLAMACQRNWDAARDLLKQGFLYGFFGGLGRVDLAMAAQEAAKFPDQDRGLDQLLSKLPTQALELPKLRVEPSEINLGMINMGTDRHFDLQLDNQGMRLLYGTVASDSKWLTLGDPPGQKSKIFQFGDETTVRVNVMGQNLRAGPKPLIGQLFIESNDGRPVTVKVKLEVPIKPFPQGALVGAKSPRDVAVKAKAAPKEAAVLFENGTVERWFKENGWIYPVQGPAGSGLGAVQQFFEALGLAKAPKVVLDKQSLAFMGNVGQSLTAVLKVETPEKRPVYAHATADESWLDVSDNRIEAKGRIVMIHVKIPNVPARPGQTLTAKIRVAANGNQRFIVPVALTVQGQPGMAYAQPIQAVPAQVYPAQAAPVFAIADDPPVMAVQAAPTQPMPALPAQPAAAAIVAAPAASTGSFTPMSTQQMNAPTQTLPGGTYQHRRSGSRQQQTPFVLHVVPMGILAFALLLIVVLDLFAPNRNAGGGFPLDKTPRISIAYAYPFYKPEVNRSLGKSMRWGVRTIPGKGEPKGSAKKLTYDIFGMTNSTLVRVDNKDFQFGDLNFGIFTKGPDETGEYGTSKTCTFSYRIKPIDITQTVKRIPGEPFEEDGKYIRALDTCLVLYEIKNRDSAPHSVGLRVVIDTYIGGNDGVPFTVPGVGLVNDMKAFPDSAPVPDFIQALERADLKDPGTVVQMNLKIGGGYQPPSRVLLTQWPAWVPAGPGRYVVNARKLHEWEVPLASLRTNAANPDSAIALYWNPIKLNPGQTYKVGFTYGLGHVASGSGLLGLTASRGSAGEDITILARVGDEKAKSVALQLPSGLTLTEGDAQQNVPPLPVGVVGRPREVSWRVRANSAGTFTIQASTDTGITQKTQITIGGGSGIFGGG